MCSCSVLSGAPDLGGEPHPALLLALPYMRLPDLFSCQRVCRPFRDSIAANPLLWRSVAVEPPLSLKLTDDALWEVASKAGGELWSLVLVDCRHITDAGLRRVANANPMLSKIILRRCMQLTANGVITTVQSLGEGVLKHIQVYGLSGMSKDHFNILNALVNGNTSQKEVKPLYYSQWCSQRLIDDDDRPIDVDICPKCSDIGMVFDCTQETCRTISPQTGCRGCLSCIDRCADCGVCLDHQDDLNTLCEHSLCLECWLAHSKCCECNRPYCREHEHSDVICAGPAEFLCEECLLKQETNLEYD